MNPWRSRNSKKANMDDYALILNAGSSSLKFCVFQRPADEGWRLESRGQIEGIGSAPSLSAKGSDGKTLVKRNLGPEIADGKRALDALADWLRSIYGGARVIAVGHRVVHGGPRFKGPVLITPDVIEQLRALIPLAPLHQPYNLGAIDAVSERLPGVPQVACFDTSFHRSQSAIAELVPLPEEIRNRGVQRYGFHGLSYEYIASTLPEVAPEIANGRVIVAHLGSGASLCALRDRVSVESTLGFTALDGLCMGTRPGSIDPGVILYLMQTLGMSAAEIEKTLYKKSGLIGISGFANDMRDLLESDDPRAQLALDYFVYQASKHIGALAAVLGGVDALVFTAGIGENSAEMRRRIARAASWLGLELDEEANQQKKTRISKPGSKVSAWVIATNEELMIARHTAVLLGIQGKAKSTQA
jgi:acetate kinase